MDDYLERRKASLSPDQRIRFDRLVERLTELEATDPEVWAISEVTENVAQFASFCFLKLMWSELIDPYRSGSWIDNNLAYAERHPTGPFADAGAALKRLIEAEANPNDLSIMARRVAYETVFGLLNIIDDGFSDETIDSGPGWALVEIDADGRLTGLQLGGLHESLLSTDPSGREGSPE